MAKNTQDGHNERPSLWGKISTTLSIASSAISIIVSIVMGGGAIFAIVILSIRYDVMWQFSAAPTTATAPTTTTHAPTTATAPTTTTHAPTTATAPTTTTHAPTTATAPTTTTQPPDRESPSTLVEEPTFWTLGRRGNWCYPPDDAWNEGHGGNGFRFTWAVGENVSDEHTAWAVWDFDSVDGTYRVDAWIPKVWATAHVKYNIWVYTDDKFSHGDAEYIEGRLLDQQAVSDSQTESDWQPLGTYELNGRIRIEVHNSEALNDYREDGLENARIAADAIRLERVPSTSTVTVTTTHSTSTTAQTTDRAP